MPHKKRGHGHHKHPKEAKEQEHGGSSQLHVRHKVSCYDKSQPSQATPKPAAQVSTVKPAQFETASSGSTMATKSGVGSTVKGGVTAGGSASVGTAGKAKTETNTTPAGATVIDMSSAGATFVDMTSAGARGAPKQMSKTAAVSQVKATATIPSAAAGVAAASGAAGSTAAGVTASPRATATVSSTVAAGVAAGVGIAAKPKESPKATAKSVTATTTVKADVHKVDPAATAAAGNVSVQGKKDAKPTQAKVQVEVPSAAATGAKEVDPFDALASSLPTAKPVKPQPIFTGPEVKEHGIASEEGVICGERDDTLPPGYRFEDMPPASADLQPINVPKPLSTDEALDSLSAGFMTETVPAPPKKQEKKDSIDSVSALSAAPSNFAPPVKKSQTPAPAVCPPADKKPKMEVCDFSLKAGLPAGLPALTATKAGHVSVCPAAPVDKKAKMTGDVSVKGGPTTKVDTTLKTDGGSTMPLAALDALAGTFPKDVPRPKEPELRPEDIVSEGKHKEEDAVLVGEREDSIAPDYRFNKEDLRKLPAPKPEPTVSTPEALDILSGDFLTSSAAPAVQAPPAQKAAVPPVSVEAGITSSAAKKVESSAVPPVKDKVAAGKDTTDGKIRTAPGVSMPTDALSGLGDLLPADAPKPKEPELRPEDIVSEDKHKEKEAVLVGEREDSIAPDYRFNMEELKKLPAPKPEPTVTTGEALDILSEGFLDSSSAPVVQAPVVCPSAPPAQAKIEDLSALDQLSGEFVAPTKASGVQAPAPPPTKKTPEGVSMPTDALSGLVDLLPADVPKPKEPELRPEDIVTEDKHKEKEAVLVGEREDSIPPEYRFNKEELMKLPAPKPEPTVTTGEALDILSEGFLDSSSAPVVQAPVVCPSAPPAQTSADFALDALAGDFSSSSAAPTVKSAAAPTVKSATAPTVKSAAAPTVKSDASALAETTEELAPGADTALDALSDILGDITPTPQPVPALPKNIVKEKEVVEERLIKMGERDDTLPPEYRLTEEDRKKIEEEAAKADSKPKKTMDDKTALDLLSSDFSDSPKPTAPAVCSAATTKLEPPVLDSQEPQKPMAGATLDSLSSTLLPDEFKSKTDKPKKQHAEDPSAATDQLPAQPSSDVVPKSTKKGGRS